MPSAPELPMTWPPLIPPPARTVVQAAGKWSRPACGLILGVRPNSPIQTISVESSSPRARRSSIRVAQAGSSTSLSFLTASKFCWCVSQPTAHAPLGRGERDLDERDAPLDQPAGQQAALTERGPAVGVAHRRGLVLQVERLGRRRAHQPDGSQVGVLVAHRADPGMARQEVLPHRVRAGRAGRRPARLSTPGGKFRSSTLNDRLRASRPPCGSITAPLADDQRGILRAEESRPERARVERTDRRDADEVGQLGVVRAQLLGDERAQGRVADRAGLLVAGPQVEGRPAVVALPSCSSSG